MFKTVYVQSKRGKSTIYNIEESTSYFYGFFRLEISLTASCKYMLRQVCLIFCCFNSLIRFVVYRSNHSIKERGIYLSGNFIMMENIMSSSRLCSLWKKSFAMLHFLISISIINHSFKTFL